MIKKILLIFIAVFSISTSFSTHIVGGEFQFVEGRGGEYDIYLNLYFDLINGNPAAQDQEFVATIFRKSDGEAMDNVIFNFVEEVEIDFANPECRRQDLATSKITYTAQKADGSGAGFQFTVDRYNDPQGYYIVWDRCCRNDSIVNIEAPGDEGMLFYLHFPAIFNSSDELIGWNSPVFPPIPATFACETEEFTLDFGATDADGDSLVFTMNTPLAGYSDPDNPLITAINPEPYPEVIWSPGIGIDNQIPGNPDLSIDPVTGILTVTPNQDGLHVFSVSCREYRNGIKIGEVKRDYQVYVYDSASCAGNEPPNLEISLGDSSIYNIGDTISISTKSPLCMDLFVTDNLDNRNDERIEIRVVPINFSTSTQMVFPGDDEYVGGLGDTLKGWQVCPPSCEDIISSDEPFIFDIIASDNGCPNGKTSRKRVTLILEQEENTPPTLSNSIADTNYLEIEVFEIDTVNISFTGVDLDSTNLISLKALPNRFRLSDFGMNFKDTSDFTHTLMSDFEWIINCEKLEGSKKDEFRIDFIINDNACGDTSIDTNTVVFRLNREIVENELAIYNIFTPNGDGINDYFIVDGLPRDNCENEYIGFEIYNRWGKLIFESDKREIKWDGGKLSDGVYFYLARYTNLNYKGHVTILR